MEAAKKEFINSKLKQIEQERFPNGVRSLQFGGKSITVLQSEILAGVQSIMVTDGRMATRLRILLDKNLEILTQAISELEPEAASYFTKIQSVAKTARACCVDVL